MLGAGSMLARGSKLGAGPELGPGSALGTGSKLAPGRMVGAGRKLGPGSCAIVVGNGRYTTDATTKQPAMIRPARRERAPRRERVGQGRGSGRWSVTPTAYGVRPASAYPCAGSGRAGVDDG